MTFELAMLNAHIICLFCSQGLPKGAVKNAMERDGLDPDIMDLDPEKSVASQLKKDEEDEDYGPPLKEDPKYEKYFKMLKMVSGTFSLSVNLCSVFVILKFSPHPLQGLPMGAVQNAVQRDGLDPSIMELDPEKSVASQLKKDEKEEDDGPPLKDDPKYQKYFKMLKMVSK